MLQLGQLDEALAEHERAYEIYRSLGLRVSQGRAANNVGVLDLRLGRYEAAAAALKEALDIAGEVGNRAGVGVAVANAILWVAGLPPHVSVPELIIKPTAQAYF